MNKMRLLAWLLIVAMLSVAVPAFAEEMEIEITDDYAVDTIEEIGADTDGDEVEIVIPDEAMADVEIDLPGLELTEDLALSDGLDATLDDALEDAPGEAQEDVQEAVPVEGLAAANAGTGKVEAPVSVGGDDNDRLLAGYVDLLFGKKPKGDLRGNGFLGDRLYGKARMVYNFLASKCAKVASGASTSARFYLPKSIGDWTQYDAIYGTLRQVVNALVTDYPYQMFWFDKTVGYTAGSDSDGRIYILLAVTKDFANMSGDIETWNNGTIVMYLSTAASQIKSVQKAAIHARQVVNNNASASDYGKLCAYRNYICNAVDYNYDAITYDYPYGNPWQLIWAFDNDPSTKIVCEGYAKAFQYLCDLSTFKSAIQCHLVQGDVWEGGEGGGHMWNIVTMGDGRNYHVDITWIDGGYTGLFLCGGSATGVANSYRVLGSVDYIYDPSVVNAYPASVLKLSASDFDPNNYRPKLNVARCKITVKNQVYTGNLLTPALTVKYGSWNMTKGTDYTVTFTTNRAVGKATATIKGKGKYNGSKKVTFNILPPAVTLSKLTAKQKSFTATWKKGTANTGYQIQYSLNSSFSGAKTFVVSKAGTVSATIKSLISGKTYYVRVRTYKKVNGIYYCSAWSFRKSVKVL